VIVLSDDAPSGAVTFGDAVADRLTEQNLLFVLTPSDVGIAGEGDVFTTTQIQDALDIAVAAGGSDRDYVTNFVHVLTGGTAAEPGGDGTSGSSGGGGSGIIWFLVIVVVVGVGVVLLVRSSRKKADASAAAKLAAAKEAVQKQVDAVANDILDMADEVSASGNPQARQYFEEASAAYTAASERLAAATTPQALLDLSNELDVAIWQLDCTEALLDGKPLPAKPEPRKPEPPPAPAGSAAPAPGPVPGYDRRSTRRSSYAGPGLLDVLIGVAGQVMAGGRVRSRGGMFGGGMFGGGMSRAGRRTTSRSSGASRPRPSSRGTGGRIRMGRSRRR